MARISKEMWIKGAGVGLGTTYFVMSASYLDTFGPIPGIGDYIPSPWNKWSTLGNILIGGAFLGVSQFTKLIKNTNLKNFLTYFSIPVLIGGVVNGIFSMGILGASRARARTARAGGVRLAPRATSSSVAPLSQTGIPAAKILY